MVKRSIFLSFVAFIIIFISVIYVNAVPSCSEKSDCPAYWGDGVGGCNSNLRDCDCGGNPLCFFGMDVGSCKYGLFQNCNLIQQTPKCSDDGSAVLESTCELNGCDTFPLEACKNGCYLGVCKPDQADDPVACQFSDWENEGCAPAGGCVGNKMSQTRTFSPQNCDLGNSDLTRCVPDAAACPSGPVCDANHCGLCEQSACGGAGCNWCSSIGACRSSCPVVVPPGSNPPPVDPPTSGGSPPPSPPIIPCGCIYPQGCSCPGDAPGTASGVQTCNGIAGNLLGSPNPCVYGGDFGCAAACNPCDCPSPPTPPVSGCDPITVAIHPDPKYPGSTLSIRASSIYPYTSVSITTGGGATLTASDPCADPAARCSAAPYVWVLPATASSTPGTYTVTFTGNKQGTNCPQTAQYTIAAATSPLTKDVARVLLNYAQRKPISDFTLFCDTYDKALNHYSYSAQGSSVNSVLSQESDGSVCVLKSGNDASPNVVFGAPLKVSLSETNSNMLKVLGDTCDTNVKNVAGEFKSCSSKKVWHRKTADDKGVIIYSEESVELFPTPASEYLQTVADLLRKLYGIPTGTTDSLNFISTPQTVDKVYVRLTNDGATNAKRVSGVMFTSGSTQKMAVEYAGFSTNPCSIINQKFAPLQPCRDVTNENVLKHVIEVECTGINVAVCNAWLDLTAKNRIQ